MGGGNSSELTPEEKSLIAGKVQEQYLELQASVESKANEIVVFETLKNTYEQAHKDVIMKRGLSANELPLAPEVSPRIKPSEVSYPRLLKATDKSLTKKHIGYSYDNDDLPHHPEFGELVLNENNPRVAEEEETDLFSGKMTTMVDLEGQFSPPGILTRTRTSSELLSQAADSALDDQTKIANFITQLKAGEVATKPSSDFLREG